MNSTRFLHNYLILLSCWSGAAVAILYLKRTLLIEHGYVMLGLYLGSVIDTRHKELIFSPLQKLSFYREDLIVAAVLIPLILLPIARWLRLRFSIPLVYLFSALIVLWVLIQRSAYILTGRFLSIPFFLDAVTWARRHPTDLVAYVSATALFRLILLLIGPAMVCSGLLLWFHRNRTPEPRLVSLTRQRAWVLACCATIVLPILVSFGPWMPITPYHRDALRLVASLAFANEDTGSSEYANMSNRDLVAHFHQLVNEPTTLTSVSPLHGKASDYDVIIWIAETLPQRFVDLRGGLTGFPNLATLSGSSLVLRRHYTTAPYSNLAVFSILCSLYPPFTLRSVVDDTHYQSLKGLPSELAAMGYDTAAFLPGDSSFATDMHLYSAAGVKRVVVSEGRQDPAARTSWQKRLHLDEIAFAQLLQSIEDWTGRDRRYFAIFFPEIGHGPFPDISGLGQSAAKEQLGEALFALQDKWIGEVIKLVQRRNRFRKTLIVVVGDHGVRTRVEDPTMAQVVLDNYTFNVPLLLYAPEIFSGGTQINAVTSHIDIAPSLLDLLGGVPPPLWQGLPLWDTALRQRRTFFLGATMVGCDGMYSDGRFYTVQSLSHAVLSSAEMRSVSAEQIRDKQEQRSVAATLESLIRMRTEFLTRAVASTGTDPHP